MTRSEIIDKIFKISSGVEAPDYERIERAILRNPMVDSCVINAAGELLVTTKRIVATDVEDDSLHLDIGRVTIVVRPSGRVYAFPANPDEFSYPSAHPNVSSDGNLCIGNAVQITDAIDARDLPMLITLIIEYLEVSNDEDGYWHPFRDNPCEVCSRPFGDNCFMCICRSCEDHDTSECRDCTQKRKCDMGNTRTELVRRMASMYGDYTSMNSCPNFKLIADYESRISITTDNIFQVAEIATQLDALQANLDSVEYAKLGRNVLDGLRRVERSV